MKFINDIINELPRVENYEGVVNQHIIKTDDFVLLQSYRSPIAMYYRGKVYIWCDAFYSRTTAKYRNMFLGENKKEIIDKLKNGDYIAVDFKVEDL